MYVLCIVLSSSSGIVFNQSNGAISYYFKMFVSALTLLYFVQIITLLMELKSQQQDLAQTQQVILQEIAKRKTAKDLPDGIVLPLQTFDQVSRCAKMLRH